MKFHSFMVFVAVTLRRMCANGDRNPKFIVNRIAIPLLLATNNSASINRKILQSEAM